MKTFKSAELFQKVKQYDRKEEKETELECPSARCIYNGNIFAVDLLDTNLSYYIALDFISKNICLYVDLS